MLHIEFVEAFELFNSIKAVFSYMFLFAQVDIFVISLDVVEIALIFTSLLCNDTM
jgi:hypothetical protein